ncbi:MAG: efflux transporter outer membrane subunit [Methylococcales bacterium]|nr:efflux transporter outer membrane subunit [Methylococcales bacterium]
MLISFCRSRCCALVCILLLGCVLLSGCIKLGPEFERPKMSVPDNWQNNHPMAGKRVDFREWWRSFNDPILDRLITMAYEQNLNLQVAALRIIEARAQLGIAKGMLFPQKQQFGTDLFYNKLSENMPNINRYSFGTFDVGFDTLWEMDIWGKYRRAIESGKANLDATTLSYDDLLVSLTAEVAATYIQIRTLQQRLFLASNNAGIQAKSLKISQALLRNSLGTNLDVQQAEALLHGTKAMIASLETGLRQTRNALSVLLGLPPIDISGLLGKDISVPNAGGEITVGIPADMLRRRPDIRREELKAAAQCAMIGIAEADLYPRLSLQGSVGIASSSANGMDIFDVLGAQTLVGKFGPTVSWPILQYGRLKNNVRIQDAKFEQLLIGYKESVLRALREVEDAMIGYHKAKEQVLELQQGVDASQRAVNLSLLHYRNGIEDYTRVLNSQQSLVQQQDRLTSAQGDAARNAIALYKAMGGGWEIRLGKELIPPGIKSDMIKRADWGKMLD